LSAHVRDCLVNDLVLVLIHSVIRKNRVGVEIGTFSNVLADFRLNILLASSRNNYSTNFATTLQCSPNRLLSLGASAGDSTPPTRQVHVDCLAADVGLVCLYFTALA